MENSIIQTHWFHLLKILTWGMQILLWAIIWFKRLRSMNKLLIERMVACSATQRQGSLDPILTFLGLCQEAPKTFLWTRGNYRTNFISRDRLLLEHKWEEEHLRVRVASLTMLDQALSKLLMILSFILIKGQTHKWMWLEFLVLLEIQITNKWCSWVSQPRTTHKFTWILIRPLYMVIQTVFNQ